MSQLQISVFFQCYITKKRLILNSFVTILYAHTANTDDRFTGKSQNAPMKRLFRICLVTKFLITSLSTTIYVCCV